MITLTTAIFLGFFHTLIGPDHYLPFMVIGRARRWSYYQTMMLTTICGIGHVLSSVLLGYIGAVAGLSLEKVMHWETSRGDWAGWSLFLFGIGYLIWGIWKIRTNPHTHYHLHSDGSIHRHEHTHESVLATKLHSHSHSDHQQEKSWKELTPWLLIIIFVLGPCEPLIPLFFTEAVLGNWSHLIAVSLGYGLATILTMNLIVTIGWFGLFQINFGKFEKYTHALAGSMLSIAGAGIVFLGW
ncbi:MAG: hypothetical protein N2450_01250 [bacterium]|nr:hypothetical protein [bacterium]